MPKFNRKAMLLCCAAMPALAISSAYAQDDEDEGDVIVVTGIKKAIEDSLTTKRESTSIVEAVSAEDIGKLPDLSIADSLARLPGLTAQRVRGRAQQISIRGLGPDFSIALLNGREQVSAGDNRGIEFDQFPAELIAQGVVYKTPDATLAASGIAGTVDLKTLRPLDFSGRQITTSARYVVNANGEINPDFDADGYRLFGSYIDQFMDGTVGVALAITDQRNPIANVQRQLKTASNQVSSEGVGFLYPSDNPRTGAQSREFTRTSVTGTLQWEPNDNTSVVVDGFYSDFEDSGIFRGVETPLASWSGAEVGSFQASGNSPFVDAIRYDNVFPVFRTDEEGRSAELFSAGINWQQQITERLKTTVDLSTSRVDRQDVDFESYAGFGAGGSVRDSVSFLIPTEGDYALRGNRDWTSPSEVLLTDPGGWGQVGFIKEPEIEDEINQLRVEAEYEFLDAPVSSVQVGFLYTERTKERVSIENFIDFADGVAPGNELMVPQSAIVGTTDIANDLGTDFLAYNPRALLADGTYVFREANFSSVIQKAWEVSEEILDFYAQANIDTLVGDMPLRGNVGFKYQDVSQESTGSSVFDNLDDPVITRGDDYTHFLPNLNLSLEFAEDTFARVSYAKVLTRPRMDQLRASQGINFNDMVCPGAGAGSPPNFQAGVFDVQDGQVCLSSSGGNPFLRPFEADSFDVAFERYFTPTTNFALGMFYKKIDQFVLDGVSVLVDNTDVLNSLFGPEFLQQNPDAAVGFNSAPQNSDDAAIYGMEATLNFSFDDLLPENLAGFGTTVSYSITETEVNVTNPDTDETIQVDIPGYSRDVWNASVYYENHGFRARLNARSRSDYFAELPNFDGELNFTTGIEETVIDAQLGYTFPEGTRLEGVDLIFEAYNLTDEPFGTVEESQPGLFFPSVYETY
ncbi:MAG: TonB-dependent receptor, partial [Pseudomonadota bacterium]